MLAIGDSEGTVSVMLLCKALYETTPKEKEVMGTIFEREFRREKNLLTSKKLAKDAAKGANKQKDMSKVMAEKEVALKETLVNLEETFFEQVAKDQEDLEVIKARGAMGGGYVDQAEGEE